MPSTTAAAAASGDATTYEDSPLVPNSPSLSNNDTAFTYTPNPNTEHDGEGEKAIGGPLHPSPHDVEYGAPAYASAPSKTQALFQGKRKWYWIGGGVLLVVVAVGAVVGGIKGSQKSSSSSSSSSGVSANDATGRTGHNGNTNTLQAGDIGDSPVFGYNGTTVTMENGQTFTYVNNFGGYFVDTPYDDSAKAQSYTPALNESWDYTNMK